MPRALKWTLIVLTTLLVLFALLIALTPTLINLFTVRWLEQQGVTVQIDRINFDFNDGILEILDARGENAQQQGFELKRFYIDLQWLPLFDKQVVIEQFAVAGLTLSAQQNDQGLQSIAGITLGGATSDPNAEPEPRPQTDADAKAWRIDLGNVQFADIQYCQQLESGTGESCFKLGQFDWQGNLGYDLAADAQAQPTAQGELSLQNVQLSQALDQLDRSVDIGRIDVQQLQVEGVNDITLAGLTIGRLVVAPGKSESGASQTLQLQQLDLRQLAYRQQQLSLNAAQLDQVKFTAQPDGQPAQTLLDVRQLKLQQVEYTLPKTVAIKQVAINQFYFAPTSENDQAVAQFAQLLIDELGFKDQLLDIRQIQLAGLGADIQRNKQGHFGFNQYLPLMRPQSSRSSPSTEQAAPAEQDAKPVQVKIGSLELVDSQPIQFVDRSLETPFEISATIKTFKLSDIDTRQPQQSSHLALKVATEQSGSIELEGDAQLTASQRDFDIKGDITGLDMRPVGAYVQTGIGHRIKSGQLNAKLNLVARGGQLDSVLDLDLKHFQLKKLAPGEKEKVDEGSGLPLSTALNLLRDRDKSIHLKIPVTGDLSSPEFDPSDAINKALSKAMTSAIISYYTPFGLVTVVEGLYNLATALTFEPVLFETGSNMPQAAATDYLDKIVKLMTERPNVYLSVCGYSNAEDVKKLVPDMGDEALKDPSKFDDPLREQISTLANNRAGYVKAYLIEKGVAGERLIICEGEYASDAVPGVVLSI